MTTETYQSETGQWGWTEAGQLWCTECDGNLMVTCQHSGPVNEYGDCWDCDGEGEHLCSTCER